MGKFPRKVTDCIICPDCECIISQDEVLEEDVWECVVCGELHKERDDAYRCCD